MLFLAMGVCIGRDLANVFNSEAKLGQYLFQGCINLAEVTLSELPSPESQYCKLGSVS